MPLSASAPRDKIHDREIACRGYRRRDGLWDIEAHLIDTKTYTCKDAAFEVPAGEPIHEMWIRLTIDEDMVIHGAEAVTDHGPYTACGAAPPRFETLIGLRIGPGWMREVGRRVGGNIGCTHLYELVRPLATTAFQTLEASDTYQKGKPGEIPIWVDGCVAHRRDGELMRLHHPEHYTGAEPTPEG